MKRIRSRNLLLSFAGLTVVLGGGALVLALITPFGRVDQAVNPAAAVEQGGGDPAALSSTGARQPSAVETKDALNTADAYVKSALAPLAADFASAKAVKSGGIYIDHTLVGVTVVFQLSRPVTANDVTFIDSRLLNGELRSTPYRAKISGLEAFALDVSLVDGRVMGFSVLPGSQMTGEFIDKDLRLPDGSPAGE